MVGWMTERDDITGALEGENENGWKMIDFCMHRGVCVRDILSSKVCS